MKTAMAVVNKDFTAVLTHSDEANSAVPLPSPLTCHFRLLCMQYILLMFKKHQQQNSVFTAEGSNSVQYLV